MSGHSGYSGAGSDPLAGVVTSVLTVALTISLIVVLIGLYLLFRCGVLIVRVFLKDPKNRTLWLSLGLCLLLCLTGWLLAWMFVNPNLLVLLGVGFLELLLTCKVVEIDKTTLFLREGNDLATNMLKTSWWADYNA